MSEVRDRLTAALVGRYTVRTDLGSGGMAVVYSADDLKTPRKVAIKVMRPWIAAALGPERFLREIEITAGLNHPHILPILESGEAEGLLFYVMPFVEGESLRDRLAREGQLSLADTVRLTREVADALHFAHGRGVIHRDIKPENVLLVADHAVVSDFGIARAITEAGGERLTATGVAVGTPAYMSPEHAVGDRELDGRTDLYSLACVTYEMLGGRPPFTATSTQALIASHSLEEVPPLSDLRSGVPHGVEDVLRKALAKRPADRYSDPLSFANALALQVRGEASTVARRLRKQYWVAITAGLIVLIGAGGWTINRSLRASWARRAIADVEQLIADGKTGPAYHLAVRAEDVLQNDPLLTNLWPEMSVRVGFRTAPAGAEFYYKEYSNVNGEWLFAGRSPDNTARIPLGFFRWQIRKPGYQTVEVASQGVRFDVARSDGTIPLHEVGTIPSDMLLVRGGDIKLDVPGLYHVDAVSVNDYLIDRFEVTNRQFKMFVDSGGYTNREYWSGPFVRESQQVSWQEAIRAFVDQTGRPGPAGWELGDYPDGQDDYPVTGISWYEARAYAQFVGKQLPTLFHWNHAAGVDLRAYILPMSNYGNEGAAPVGAHRGLGPFGTYDMAGNASEWVSTATGNGRFLVGGAWDEEPYLFYEVGVTTPWDRSSRNGMRLMKSIGPEPLPPAATAPVQYQSPDFHVSPVPDNEYRIYRRLYTYDETALDPIVEATDDSGEDWRRERISFRTAYGDERMTVYLFLPQGIDPPYQVVVFFPGSNAIHQRSSTNLTPGAADFIVKDGRALLYPIYQGSYERDVGLDDDDPDSTNAYRDLVIMLSKDLGRSIDYLETRPDVDTEKIGYFGVSWGAGIGAVLLAVEPRLDAAVLWGGGLWLRPPLPEADQRTFAPRVSVPVLMLNGRYDPYFPIESSQRPMFRSLGTKGDQKRHRVFESGHTLPRNLAIGEALQWLDRYLGPVN